MKQLFSIITMVLLVCHIGTIKANSPILIALDSAVIDSIPVDSKMLDSLDKKMTKIEESLKQVAEIIAQDTIGEITVGSFTFFENKNIPVYRYTTRKEKKAIRKIKREARKNKEIKGTQLGKQKAKQKGKIKTDSTVTISKIILDIRDGTIFDIQAITVDNKNFTNKRIAIEINRSTDDCDLLGFSDGNKIIYIQFCDILKYERMGGAIPRNRIHVLTKKGEVLNLKKSVGIDQVLSIKLYSDILGLTGQESNGLVQTEVEFVTPIIFLAPIRNTNIFFLKNFKFDINLSRLDEEFKYTKTDSDDSRQILNQRSWLSSNVGINVFSALLKRKSNTSISTDFVAGFSVANAITESDTSSIALAHLGFEPNLSVRVSRNIGMSLKVPLLWQKAPQLKDIDKNGRKCLVIPEFELNWNPLDNPGSKVFGRVRYAHMNGVQKPYWQVQLGYNLSLSEIINKQVGSGVKI